MMAKIRLICLNQGEFRFNAIFPSAFAMRYSDKMPWEKGEGYADVTCPDGDIVVRLTRVKDDEVQI